MARNIVFVAPFPTDVTLRFARACAGLSDVKVLGIVHTPFKGKDAALFHDKVRVEDFMSAQGIIEGVAALAQRHGPPHRIIGVLEHLQVQIAEARARFGVPGTTPKVADLFRDKARMKEALAKAGLPVARNRLLTSVADGKAFTKEVGFPIVIKPPAGVGSKSTYRVRSAAELAQALEGLGVSANNPMLGEEFLTGKEHSFETITVGGKPRVHSISTYHPTCLEAVENPWIQWCCMLPRDISGKQYDDARQLGLGAVKALGLDAGMTHMEWFRRPDGSLAIGEIAQRPAGANISIMMSYAYDRDIYRAWCRSVVDFEVDLPWERKYAVGTAFLRGMGRGRVAGSTGIKAVLKAFKPHICETKLPVMGTPKSDSYEGDGYIVVRHPETAAVSEMLDRIIETVKIHYA
jgi:biotin carboxylase